LDVCVAAGGQVREGPGVGCGWFGDLRGFEGTIDEREGKWIVFSTAGGKGGRGVTRGLSPE